MTPRPTAELWRLLQEATAEADRRGHNHVGSEHLLFVCATTPRTFASSLLEHLRVSEPIAARLETLMSSGEYDRAASNAMVDEDGRTVGHLVVGPDGRPTIERSQTG
jgi:ATP-dependent Clp protease ATP-binding subunit ClpA